MNIRNTLAVLFMAFGLTLAALLVPQVLESNRTYTSTNDQIVVDQARNDVFEAVLALRKGRTALTLLAMRGEAGIGLRDDLAAAVMFLNRAAQTFAMSENAVLRQLSDPLAQQADRLSDNAVDFANITALGDAEAIAAALVMQQQLFVEVQHETLLVRQQILQEVGIPDTVMGALQMMRNYILSVSNALNDDLVLAAPNGPDGNRIGLRQVQSSVDRMTTINQFYSDIASAYRPDTIMVALDLAAYLDSTYLPTLNNYVAAVSGNGNLTAAQRDWATTVNDADLLVNQTTARLFAMSQAHLTSEREEARRMLNMMLILTAFVVVMFGLSLYLVTQHIVRPLTYVQLKINDIAAGHLDPIIRKKLLLRDLDTVFDALRALRISSRRREMLTADRLALNEHIVEAHGILRSEVDAAAKVQLSLLPRPERVGHIRFSSLFQPSSVVAGDTYDFINLSDTRVGLFQIDVAGHGAAAGLVSMAAHISARRALRGIKPDINLAQSVQTMNAHWSPELTYFTALFVEFDATSRVARLVQAGHPHPVLMRKDGKVLRIGQGGLPIGVVDGAVFDMIEFDFDYGDRLLVFSDGIYENFNSEGEIYSEERLVQLLQDNASCSTADLVEVIKSSVVSWNKAGVPSDDVSLVIAERI
ncbi:MULTISPECIES: PP2C family protein-serine/threonine phosphatase [unclassified Yoonia]|uniref:PP2C family protein-serine/threonine phosphatase n=1 Tax=unclassified Yoonia TaxID=2629118 RepID=UPI002AFDF51C|nr:MULTISPECIES: PP2C family protein-serine/threonine phosphatase [unclassified Yoonia]